MSNQNPCQAGMHHACSISVVGQKAVDGVRCSGNFGTVSGIGPQGCQPLPGLEPVADHPLEDDRLARLGGTEVLAGVVLIERAPRADLEAG